MELMIFGLSRKTDLALEALKALSTAEGCHGDLASIGAAIHTLLLLSG
jgi:hypothetical protein